MKGKHGLPLVTLVCLTGLVGCGSDYETSTPTQATTETLIESKGNHQLCNDLFFSLGTDAAVEVCTREAQAGDLNAQVTLANLYLNGTLGTDDYKQALPWLILAASQGHTEAQMQVARSLQLGRGTAKNEEQAFHWIQLAAKGNHPEAQVALGQCYLEGKGVAKDENMAITWFSDCAQQGNTEAMYQLAALFLSPGPHQKVDEAQSLLQTAAENGHALSMLKLGKLYHEGTVIPKDDSKALYWYSQANSQNQPEAEYELAMLLLKETWEINEDPVHLLNKAAEQNYVPAQLALAKIYQDGQKVPRNEANAFSWYLRAAKMADPEAYYQIGLSFVHGQLRQPKNMDLGVDYLKQAAELNYMPAQYTLANLYLDGNAVLVDRQQAMDYLMQAANSGWIDAQLKLAQALIEFSLPQYDKAAFHWLQKAGNHQHIEALYQLANCYHDGIGTAVDYAESLRLYKDLASREFYPAHFKLGQMYFEGKGVEKDIDTAKKWLLSAALYKDQDAQNWLKQYFDETDETLADKNLEGELNEWLENSALNAPLLYQQGLNYLYAKRGYSQNIQAGMSCLQEAAEKEYVPAQRELAIIFDQGLFGYEGAIHDANSWYLRAAKNGDNYSQFKVANMYYTGSGVEKNMIQAYAFASMAAKQGRDEAIMLSDELAKNLDENELAVAQMIIKQTNPSTL
ncbi:MAG: SEL1-like repeat protein [Candidatus Berkiella sp.]